MKKFVCFVLVLCLVSGCFGMGAFASTESFSDVREGQWFYEPVMAAASAGLAAGNADGTYAPGRELKWAEAVVFAVRLDQYLKGLPLYGAEDQSGLWYSIYTDYALAEGFVDAMAEDPGAVVTRGEAADIFARVLMQGDYECVNRLENDHFSDVPADHRYNSGVMALAGAGIVNGVSDGVFGVDSHFKRSEVATIVARMAGLSEKVSIAPSTHSPLYIEGLSVEKVIEYFAEVCLDTEIGDKAANQYVRKWTQPVYYRVFGFPTAEDSATLDSFVAAVNAIPGFPGMYATTDDYKMNLEIYFYGESDFNKVMGSDFIGFWGGVTFWYEKYEIYSEKIAVRADIPQSNRYSIIPEEIYNGLGPVQDTTQRFDSIIYQWSDLNTAMSREDELILKLLYDPAMRPGMGYEECAEVIRTLYY